MWLSGPARLEPCPGPLEQDSKTAPLPPPPLPATSKYRIVCRKSGEWASSHLCAALGCLGHKGALTMCNLTTSSVGASPLFSVWSFSLQGLWLIPNPRFPTSSLCSSWTKHSPSELTKRVCKRRGQLLERKEYCLSPTHRKQSFATTGLAVTLWC